MLFYTVLNLSATAPEGPVVLRQGRRGRWRICGLALKHAPACFMLLYSPIHPAALLWRPTGVLLPASEARDLQGTRDNSPIEKVCLSENSEARTVWRTRWQEARVAPAIRVGFPALTSTGALVRSGGCHSRRFKFSHSASKLVGAEEPS